MMQFNQIRAIFYTEATEATEKKRQFFTKSKRENRKREIILQREKEKKRKMITIEFFRWLRWLKIHIFNLLETSRH